MQNDPKSDAWQISIASTSKWRNFSKISPFANLPCEMSRKLICENFFIWKWRRCLSRLRHFKPPKPLEVAACCSVLPCVAVCCSVLNLQNSQQLDCVAVCCSALQCVAVCCSVLQCVAVCCSVFKLSEVRLLYDQLHVSSWTHGTCDSSRTRCAWHYSLHMGPLLNSRRMRLLDWTHVQLIVEESNFWEFEHTATHCNTLQRTATHCNTV